MMRHLIWFGVVLALLLSVMPTTPALAKSRQVGGGVVVAACTKERLGAKSATKSRSLAKAFIAK